jgi:crossover junction endodeoxyribonuclease RuvC
VTVLGIDLSLTCTGLAIAEFTLPWEGRIAWTGTVKTPPSGNALDARTLRLRDIRNQCEAAVMRYNPVLAVIEAPSFGSVHGAAHDRSGLWWLVVDMLFLRSIPTAQVAPTARAKYGTGKGNAPKDQVHKAVQTNYGTDDLPIRTNDEADALLLAAMGARHLGQPVELWLPTGAIDAMEKVKWL